MVEVSCGFQALRCISLLGEGLLDSKDGICSVELFISLFM